MRCPRPVTVSGMVLLVLAMPLLAGAQIPRRLLLTNGGFEQADGDSLPGWTIGDELSARSSERSYRGRHSLRIADTSETRGSNVYSERFPLLGRADYVVAGWIYLEEGQSGDHLGVYARFRDEQNNEIRTEDGKQLLVRPALVSGRWVPFFWQIDVPEGASSIDLWLHTFNAATLTCFVDELKLWACSRGAFAACEGWTGMVPDEDVTHEAPYSFRWAHAEDPALARTFTPPADWSQFSGISFWMHSPGVSEDAVMLLLISENPRTEGMDYWSRKIVLDWTGWRQFVFAFNEMGRNRHPVGTHRIEAVRFVSTGWGLTPNPDLVLHVEALRPVNVSR